MKFKQLGRIVLGAIAGVTLMSAIIAGGSQLAHAETTAVVAMNKKIAKTAMVAKHHSGDIQRIKVSGKTASIGSAIHHLKSYSKTTWQATRKLKVSEDGQSTTYYYVRNTKGTVAGFVKASVLKRGTTATTLIGTAKSQLGKHYRYGAVGPYAFDCSGLTGYVFKKAANKTLPRTAQSQYSRHSHVKKASLKKGDLAFFGSNAMSISHVGLYIGGGKMIDAQNRGVIVENVSAPWWHVVGYSRPMTVTQV
ncbi:C40 family peptidase [uncultured Secundilactobacillus sp.]|uniref:C40 family peptidase n=1 Tax=uncultured Secundilactobacillus sp. TaxID=2813935 RepID=UPI00258DD125|nr:NlpC/P60 family protein [uncultured Secundilactobacillus sp.]